MCKHTRNCNYSLYNAFIGIIYIPGIYEQRKVRGSETIVTKNPQQKQTFLL